MATHFQCIDRLNNDMCHIEQQVSELKNAIYDISAIQTSTNTFLSKLCQLMEKNIETLAAPRVGRPSKRKLDQLSDNLKEAKALQSCVPDNSNQHFVFCGPYSPESPDYPGPLTP
jgi:hypothetical protein